MPFEVAIDHSTHLAVVRCKGRLVRGEPVHELKQAVTANPNARVVLIDLSEVETIDGGGLGVLVMLRRWSRDNGISLKLVSPSPFVSDLLERTHLRQFFEVSSVTEVLAILGCQHPVPTQLPIAC
jgi:anti-anti-sigma factor